MHLYGACWWEGDAVLAQCRLGEVVGAARERETRAVVEEGEGEGEGEEEKEERESHVGLNYGAS